MRERDLDRMQCTTLTSVLGAPITTLTLLGTSFAGQLFRVTSSVGVFALKWAEQPRPGALAAEARGLSLLAAAGALRIPTVVAVHDPSSEAGDGILLEQSSQTHNLPDHLEASFLLIEWLEGDGTRLDQAALGVGLAHMHQQTSASYGLDHDNYLGGSPQFNRPDPDWPRFFREQRLRPQIELAARNGLLSPTRRRGLERLLARVDDLLAGVPRQPALIHGDLWPGNVLTTAGGVPALIDPAVHYADREAELAFSELFGGLGARCYAAYHEVWPLEPGYPERRDLYNLYHLLNHLNLFGEGYGAQVDAILRYYGG